MKSLPKISIVIPSYNKVEYIQETLESIVSQKYPNLEVIVQDGGSTDGTLEIIKKYVKKYPEQISWVSKKDKGQVDAINKGMRKTTGDVLAFINADDVYEKGALKAIGEYYKNNPDTLWLAGEGKIINHSGQEISKWVSIYKNFLLKKNNLRNLLMVNYLVQPSIFLNKKAYNKYGPFIGTKKYVMEYDLWLKLGKVEMPIIVNDCFSGFRLAMENISTTQFKSVLAKDFRLAKKYTQNPIILLLHIINNIGRIINVFLIMKTRLFIIISKQDI